MAEQGKQMPFVEYNSPNMKTKNGSKLILHGTYILINNYEDLKGAWLVEKETSLMLVQSSIL